MMVKANAKINVSIVLLRATDPISAGFASARRHPGVRKIAAQFGAISLPSSALAGRQPLPQCNCATCEAGNWLATFCWSEDGTA